MKKIEPGKKSIPIQYLLFGTFILGLLVTVSVIGSIIFLNWTSSAEETIARMADETNASITEDIDAFISVPLELIRSNQGILENELIDINNASEREKFFVNALSSNKSTELYSFSYGSEAGEYYGARKNAANVIEIMRNNASTGGKSWYYSVKEDLTADELVLEAGAFDARTRNWYKVAKEKGELGFSQVYKHFVKDDLTVSAAAPVYDSLGNLKGVLGAHIILSSIDEYLDESTKETDGLAVIAERETGALIGNSFGADNFEEDGNQIIRKTMMESGNKLAVKIAEEYALEGRRVFVIEEGGALYHVRVENLQLEGLDWLIVSAVPESILAVGIADSIRLSLILTGMALLLSGLGFLVITRRMVKPIEDLLRAKEKFIAGDLTQRAVVVRNDDIGKITSSFNKMAETIHTLVEELEDKIQERTKELEENKNQLQLILDSTAEAIYGIDDKGRCTFINRMGVRMLGYDSQEELIGQNMHWQIHHSYKNGETMEAEDCKVFKALLNGKGTQVDDEVFWKKDGTSFNVEYYSYPQISEGKVVGAVITFMDNTLRKKMEEIIFSEKEQFKTTLLSVGDAVISTDEKGKILIMNPIAEKLTGWKQADAQGESLEKILHIIHEHTRESCTNPAKIVLENGEIIELPENTILISKLGEEIPIEDSAAPIRNSEGEITGVVVVFRDSSEKKEKQRQIEYLSFHDELTGLYNRHYMEDATQRLDQARNLPFSIMILDVNGLKLVNDAFGHEMGDQLLRTIAKVLSSVCRGDEIIGRLGGDEFGILLPRTDKHQAEEIKKRIKKALSEEKLGSVIVSAAIGTACKNSTEDKIDAVKILADNNMYKDKLRYGKTMRSQTIETVLRNLNFKYDEEQIHTERVSEYCEAIAVALNFAEKEIKDLKIAGILHDIGKIMVPPDLLRKTERLTEEEYEIIKRHPEISYQILKAVDEYSSLAEDVLYHHERMDGTGYPEGLSGDQIPYKSRIIAVADAYEAMTAKRPYNTRKTKEEAIQELISCSGTQFDAGIVKVFVEKVL